MNQIYNILKEHFLKYNKMLPLDAIKLIYQHQFGAEHYINDKTLCLEKLRREYSDIVKSDSVYYENIGNNIARLYLNGIPETSLKTVNNIFLSLIITANHSKEEFINKCTVVNDLADEGIAPFSKSDFSICFEDLKQRGFQAVHHSDEYKKAYSPSYRLIQSYYADFLPLIFSIDKIINEKGYAVIAIDGDCAAGKTTLAQMLSKIYSASVIAMDDFFLPIEMRTPQRLSIAGENIHKERFLEEVASKLQSHKSFCYKKYNCQKNDYDGSITVTPNELIIVEGSYSMHPEYSECYDIKTVLCVPNEKQIERLIARGSGNMLSKFVNEWIPMEKKYHNTFSVLQNADYIFNT